MSLPSLFHQRWWPAARRRAMVPLGVSAMKTALHVLAPVRKRHIFHKERLFKALDSRGLRPLITVANHTATIDEPFLWSLLMPLWRLILHDPAKYFRFCLGAEEIMFFNTPSSYFFDSGQVIPVVRGKGLLQPGVFRAIDVLNQGGWIHLMPEGRINTTGHLLTPLRWGVGKLVESSNVPPLVLPIYHLGFDKMMPIGKPYIPRPFQTVGILIGEPMNFDEMVYGNRQKRLPPEQTYKDVTNSIQQRLLEMEREMHELSIKHWR